MLQCLAASHAPEEEPLASASAAATAEEERTVVAEEEEDLVFKEVAEAGEDEVRGEDLCDTLLCALNSD